MKLTCFRVKAKDEVGGLFLRSFVPLTVIQDAVWWIGEPYRSITAYYKIIWGVKQPTFKAVNDKFILSMRLHSCEASRGAHNCTSAM
jgi:hypothetical protein